MVDVIKETLEKLKKENLKPISRRMFLLRKTSKWILVLVLSAFSGIALAATIFLVFQFDWDMHPRFGGPIPFGFKFLPFLWMAVGGILVFGVYEAVRHTKSGYKYNWKKMSVIMAGLVLGVGIFAHFSDLGSRADFFARKGLPGYGMIVPEMKDQWMDPENGFLAGEIVVTGENEIGIEDFEGNSWRIILDGETFVRPKVQVSNGEGIKVIGKKISENEFEADEIRPWMGNMMQRDFDHDEFREKYAPAKGKVKGKMDEGLGSRGQRKSMPVQEYDN